MPTSSGWPRGTAIIALIALPPAPRAVQAATLIRLASGAPLSDRFWIEALSVSGAKQEDALLRDTASGLSAALLYVEEGESPKAAGCAMPRSSRHGTWISETHGSRRRGHHDALATHREESTACDAARAGVCACRFSLPLMVVPLVIRAVNASYDLAFARDLDDASRQVHTELDLLNREVTDRTQAVVRGPLISEIRRRLFH